jgi:hypothetical protein
MFIFHVIGMRESVLMARFLFVACGTHVPIFNVESAHVTHVLVCKKIDDVGEPLVSLGRIKSRRDVRDHIEGQWNYRRHWDTTTATTMCMACTSAAAVSSTTTISARMVEWLLLVTWDRRRGVDLRRLAASSTTTISTRMVD